MSGQVTTQTRVWPGCQGVMVTPSGRLLSDRQRPTGSSADWVCALARDILTMVLIAACHGRRPALILQLRPCVANSSTWPPHRVHEWGQQRGTPRQRPCTTSSSRFQPGSGLLRLNSQESRSLPGAHCRAQQLLLCCFNVGVIPRSLVLFH